MVVSMKTSFRTLLPLALFALAAGGPDGHCAELVGIVTDAATRNPIPARVYVQSSAGKWLFVQSASEDGNALPYREQWVPMPQAIEKHTTISAHPFRIDLEPGEYTITIEHGKEYHPLTRKISIGAAATRETFALQRWINMADMGWYSGETHVHRRISELPNVQLAEDLNVSFPVAFWTTEAYKIPTTDPSPLRQQGPSPFGPRKDCGHQMIEIDASHVIYPRNTEYEIFSVNGQPHTLGVLSILNHHSVLDRGIPPVKAVAEQAHREGGLIDLEKHSWPWSMMLVPVAKVDLYELSNNSVWKTNFGFRGDLGSTAPYMKIDTDDVGMTEWGWIQFGMENYYTLLNCGFRLQPTAGTASGVHPVPLGYSRVYVQLDGNFQGDQWLDSLKNGRSFVTTGPMLLVTVDGRGPGSVFAQEDANSQSYRVQGRAVCSQPLEALELINNGNVVATVTPKNRSTDRGAFESRFDVSIDVSETCWLAVRCVEKTEHGRRRFAHTAPWHFEVADQPIRPRRVDVEYLIHRVQREIDRNANLLPTEVLAEYEEALAIYRQIAKRAR
jgi:hypothetical protein